MQHCRTMRNCGIPLWSGFHEYDVNTLLFFVFHWLTCDVRTIFNLHDMIVYIDIFPIFNLLHDFSKSMDYRNFHTHCINTSIWNNDMTEKKTPGKNHHGCCCCMSFLCVNRQGIYRISLNWFSIDYYYYYYTIVLWWKEGKNHLFAS